MARGQWSRQPKEHIGLRQPASAGFFVRSFALLGDQASVVGGERQRVLERSRELAQRVWASATGDVPGDQPGDDHENDECGNHGRILRAESQCQAFLRAASARCGVTVCKAPQKKDRLNLDGRSESLRRCSSPRPGVAQIRFRLLTG